VKIRVFPRVLRLACLPVLYPCLRRLPMGREGLSQRRRSWQVTRHLTQGRCYGCLRQDQVEGYPLCDEEGR